MRGRIIGICLHLHNSTRTAPIFNDFSDEFRSDFEGRSRKEGLGDSFLQENGAALDKF
jgi:hypothetical protein